MARPALKKKIGQSERRCAQYFEAQIAAEAADRSGMAAAGEVGSAPAVGFGEGSRYTVAAAVELGSVVAALGLGIPCTAAGLGPGRSQ